MKLTKDQKDLFVDLREILDVLGAASKWGEDIIKYWETHEPAKPTGPQAVLRKASLGSNDFVPEENSEGYIEVKRETLSRLCQCYVELTDTAIAVDQKGKAFEEFSKSLFGLVKGWRLVDANARLEDCEIDIIYDISRGPAILRERMGQHIFVECKNRSHKSEVRDISHFIMNLKMRHLTAGIFFAYNGITGYDPASWRSIADAYRRIIEVCRQEAILVVPLVKEDIEAMKNGRNLVDHLLELLDRFVQV